MTSKVFLDTNIFLDHLLGRNSYSIEIIKFCERKFLSGFASSASFFTLAYIIEERLKKAAQPILLDYSSFIETIPTTQDNLNLALTSTFEDTEDAFQYYTALNEKRLNYLITNNTSDFKEVRSKLPIVSSKEFMAILSKEL
jgi:predicted nucleic acid-binding protein